MAPRQIQIASGLQKQHTDYSCNYFARSSRMNVSARLVCFTVLLSALSFQVAAEDFTNAIGAFLRHRVDVERRGVAVVIGLTDAHGSRVISQGKLDNGTDEEVNGDTVFEIGSVTKTFTGLLLQDMVERGQMKLDDPVAKYLPASVKLPTYHGQQITLLHLATHTSGYGRLNGRK